MKINWKQKLTSRKFWAALIGFVTAILVAFHADELTIESVTAIFSAMGLLAAYVLAEGKVDAARAAGQSSTQEVMSNNDTKHA